MPDGATPQTEVRRTVQSRRRYYVRMPPGTRSLADPVRLEIRTVVEPELLEPDSDIRAVACDAEPIPRSQPWMDDPWTDRPLPPDQMVQRFDSGAAAPRPPRPRDSASLVFITLRATRTPSALRRHDARGHPGPRRK